MTDGFMNGSRAEAELTRKLAQNLVQREVMEPMAVMGWRQGTPPSPEQTAEILVERARKNGAPEDQVKLFCEERGIEYRPPVGGTTPPTVGAPASDAAPVAQPASGTTPTPAVTPAVPATPAKTDASVDGAAAQNVLALMEGLRDANGLIMGKYKTVDEALKGAGHLANMAKSALARAEAAEARLASPAAAQTFSPAHPAAAPAAAPARTEWVAPSRERARLASERLEQVLSRVESNGGSFDKETSRDYAAATREVAAAESRVAGEEADHERDSAKSAEDARWAHVNAYMADKHPDSAGFDTEVGLFVRSNPLLAEAVEALVAQGRETRAAELGWTEFKKAREAAGLPVPVGMSRADAERKEVELSERERVRIEARNEALKDAGIIHSSAGGSSSTETPGITGPSQDDIDNYAQAMRREGEAPGSAAAMRWRHATIGRFLPPGLFDSR